MYDRIITELYDDLKCCKKCGHNFKPNDIIITGIKNYELFICCRECLDQPLMDRVTYKYEPKQRTLF